MATIKASVATEPPQRSSLGQPVPVATHFVPTSGLSTSASSGGASTASQGTASNTAGGASAPNANVSASSSTSLVNPTSLALSLPHSDYSVPISHVDAQALHYLTVEMPHVLRSGARRSARRRKVIAAQMRQAGFDVNSLTLAVPTEQQEDDEVAKRLEAIGSHVGATFAERLSRDRPAFATTLDVLKFVCKELWTALWDKQVDNLRTNHRGVYVLQDNVFKPLLRLSVPGGPHAPRELTIATRMQLALPTGILRGALARLGVTSTVLAETNVVPQCTFHVKTNVQQRS